MSQENANVDEVKGLAFKMATDKILIVRDGHFVGRRSYQGGSALIVLTDGGRRKALTIQFFCVRIGDTVHEAMAVIDDGGDAAPEYADVPSPFDRWRVGGEKLPPLPDARTS